MKVKDLIVQPVDVDVYDDVCEELCIAMCGPVELTEEGKRRFAEVLEYEVTLGDGCAVVSCDGPDGVWQKKLKEAKRFFEGAAGYCSEEDYEKWFKEEE